MPDIDSLVKRWDNAFHKFHKENPIIIDILGGFKVLIGYKDYDILCPRFRLDIMPELYKRNPKKKYGFIYSVNKPCKLQE